MLLRLLAETRNKRNGSQERRRTAALLSTLAVLVSCLPGISCGDRVTPIGILVNNASVTKTRVGSSPPDLPFREFVAPGSYQRVKRVDVLGDSREESIVELSNRHGIEVRDAQGSHVLTVRTHDYSCDFGVVRYPTSQERAVAVLTYPDERWGSTFTVFSVPDGTPLAKWQEYPFVRAGFFGTGQWGSGPAVFYIYEGHIVARSPDGAMLDRLPLAGVDAFSFLDAGTLSDGRTVFMASTNGGIHNHMVAVYDLQGRLLFHEQGIDNAFRLVVAADGAGFDVETRTDVWRYHVGASNLQ